MSFMGLAQTSINSETSQSGCMFTRSSTITYNLTSQDTFTRFLCESGNTKTCETGTAKQYVNITIEWSYTTTDEESSNICSPSTDGTSAADTIVGGMMRITLFILLFLLVA
ncbi:uncharacterized protein [Magallana gigas]|uniref:uncharacterized protein n=1 Tax=Magallana gigas TaxID=29159 RepID=UPI003340F576